MKISGTSVLKVSDLKVGDVFQQGDSFVGVKVSPTFIDGYTKNVFSIKLSKLVHLEAGLPVILYPDATLVLGGVDND